MTDTPDELANAVPESAGGPAVLRLRQAVYELNRWWLLPTGRHAEHTGLDHFPADRSRSTPPGRPSSCSASTAGAGGIPFLDGGTVRLPRLVGQGRAAEIILTGRSVPASEAACDRALRPAGSARPGPCGGGVARPRDRVLPAGVRAGRDRERHRPAHEVAKVHVVGITDERLGEVGMAFVQLKEGRTLAAEDVIEHCRASLANYKVPRRVEFTDDFPMTATGNIQKYRWRDRAVDELGLADLAARRLSTSGAAAAGSATGMGHDTAPVHV